MFNKKNINRCFMLFLFIFCFIFFNNLYAAEDEKNVAYKDIEQSMEYIKQNINYVNNKITQIKRTDIYKTYPAIRLNVETPLFGINSTINNKLVIKENVATTDIINKYSVYDIIRTNSVKVPSLSVGSVVVSTRDIKLDDEMTMSDLNSSLSILLTSMNKSDEVKNFIDEYTNKTLYEYISKDKKDLLSKVDSDIKILLEKLNGIDNKLILLNVLNTQVYDECLKEYNAIYDSIYSIKDQNKNILITDEQLQDNIENIDKLSKDIEALLKKVNENIEKLDVNLDNVGINFIQKSNDYLNNIDLYLNNSQQILSLEEIKEMNNTDDSNSYSSQKYPVISENSINLIEDEIKKMVETKLEYENSEKKYEYDSKEYNEILNKYIGCYTNIIENVKNFYNSNCELLLDDVAIKSKSISEYTDENIVNDFLYSNFYAPNELKKTSQKYDDYKSTISNLNVVTYINTNMNKIMQRYIKINNLYSELTKLGKVS